MTVVVPAERPARATGSPLLSVEDLVVRFRTHDATVYAVNGITFAVAERETLGLVGESGCGKSVTSLAIMRLLAKPAGRIEGGRVVFEGRDLVALRDDEVRDLRGRELAMIFQDPMTSLNPVLTIEEQLVETLQAHRRITKEKARSRALELLAMVGIPQPENRLRAYPHQFSGGMRQRVMIAMALALEPRLLIADEPTTALDVTIQAQVLELIKDLTAKTGTAVILITHDLGVVAGMTQRVNVMYAGFIVETGSTTAIFERPSHPYTVGLLHSIPRLDESEDGDLIPIEGTPPNQRQAPVGCPFAPRCAWREARCWTENPGDRGAQRGRGDRADRSERDPPDRLPQSADRRRGRRRPAAAAGVPRGARTRGSRARRARRARHPGRHRRAGVGPHRREPGLRARRVLRGPPARIVPAGGRRVTAPAATRAPAQAGEPLLEVDDLAVWFPITEGMLIERHVGDVRAVDGISFMIRRGETLGLVGSPGAARARPAGRSSASAGRPAARSASTARIWPGWRGPRSAGCAAGCR